MEDTPHLVAHFLAVGAEQRLDDYYFLRNTYETVTGQEVQLNRILRMLDEDEIHLNWHVDTTPIGRARSRSLYDFNRTGEPVVLPGSIAYERFREMEDEDLKKRSSSQFSSRRVHERRKKSTDQRDSSLLSNSNYDDNKKPSRSHSNRINENDSDLTDNRRSNKRSNDIEELELISFSVLPLSNKKILCQWASPSSSSGVDYFTIEHELNDNRWSTIGNPIDKSNTEIELDLSSLINNDNFSSRFRLKAHLKNDQIFTSKPTDKISLGSIDDDENILIPNVEILSNNSVELTWKTNDKQKQNYYDVEMKETNQTEWKKVSQISPSENSLRLENLNNPRQCQFRLVKSIEKLEDENESDFLTVHNVNEWLSSLKLVPKSSSSVDVDVSEEGFKQFDRYKVEYATIDQLDQWKRVPDVTNDVPHLTVENLEQGTNYKFRFTPILRGTTPSNEKNLSQFSIVLDVKTPSTKKGRLIKGDKNKFILPPEFVIHQIDPTSVLIAAIIPTDQPISIEENFDVFSKREETDDKWTKIGTIDKDHLSVIVKNLQSSTVYQFKIQNQSTSDEQNNVRREFQFQTSSVKLYDPSLFLEKIEQGLENVVNGVMRAAAGHETLETPMNISLNEVIKEIFQDENLVPNEQYGFDTLALTNDLQLFRGPKQMMLQELEINETNESSKLYGEIIIHNYRRSQNEQKQPVIVREESGNTCINNIDGDVIIRNVVTDVLLKNEETRNQLSMNIVGQAFLRGVQGTLIASKFKGIIVVKNVNKP